MAYLLRCRPFTDPREIDSLAVEYFRLLSAGVIRELYRAADFIEATKANDHTPGSKDAYKYRKQS